MSVVTGFKRRKPPIGIDKGGTGETTAPEARAALDVPSLLGGNVFAGNNTFSGDVTMDANLFATAVAVSGTTATNGTLTASAVAVFQAAVRLQSQNGFFTFIGDLALDNTWSVAVLASGNAIVTLPDSAVISGQLYILKNAGAGTLTLATTSSQTIDGAAPGTIAAGATQWIISDGANWYTL